MTDRKAAGSASRARLVLLTVVAALASLDLAVKAWAVQALSGGRGVDLGPVQLRLVFNPGVAFSLGAQLPPAVVLAVTGAIIAAMAVVAWRAALTLPMRTASAVVLAGAIANFTDRAADGTVTDYLHTGWFPTFNGADVLITVGAAALLLASLRPIPQPTDRSKAEL